VPAQSDIAATIDDSTIELGLQLAVTAGFVLIMTVIHAVGLITVSRMLRLNDERLREHDVNARAIMLMAQLGLSVFTLHLLEIALFGGFYLAVGGVETVEEALYFSASAYATLGRTAEYFPDEWRLIGAVEALIGFVLIGWSTAFMVNTMTKLTESSPD
jgi:drug/metabolite transporter superfamily protein YnfA